MERSDLNKYAKTLAYRKGSLLQVGIGDGRMVNELRKHSYTFYGLCESNYKSIQMLKDKGIKSDDKFTYYNNTWQELCTKDNRFDSIYLDETLLSDLAQVLSTIKKILTPGGMFTYFYNKSNEDSKINKLCAILKLTITWIPIQGTLIPFISYKEPIKSKWVSVIKK